MSNRRNKSLLTLERPERGILLFTSTGHLLKLLAVSNFWAHTHHRHTHMVHQQQGHPKEETAVAILSRGPVPMYHQECAASQCGSAAI